MFTNTIIQDGVTLLYDGENTLLFLKVLGDHDCNLNRFIPK